ncbi:MAG: VOC family protein [Acidobacteriaceae bacterium]
MYKSILAFAAVFSSCLAYGQGATATRPAITGISHVTVYSNDFSKSESFYGPLLGWVQVPSAGAASGVRFYANHSQYVELIAPPTQEDPADRLVSVAFETKDADALRRYLGAHGVAVPAKVTVEKDGSRDFMTSDPEGNKVEFTQDGKHAPKRPKSSVQPLSTHIIHVGYMIRDRAKADGFYKDLLGFRLYWQGGQKGATDYVSMQVPDGTDWMEYMLSLPANPSRERLGAANHFAPGVVSVAETQSALEGRGWKPSPPKHAQIGRDGKWQLNLYDPDGTRVEFMEFKPVNQPCCNPFTGPQPTPSAGW